MRYLLTNILLALAWAALSGQVSMGNFLIGFFLGYLILGLQQRIEGESTYYLKVWQFLNVAVTFVVSLLLSSLVVAFDVITPRHRAHPGIVSVPIEAETELEIMLLADRISLTPGTLLLDVSPDRSTMYVHVMFMKDANEVRRKIKEQIETPLLELMR
jgi:multicomponent Na+:H+ antiporter subunit E